MTHQPSFCVGNIQQVLDAPLPVWIKVGQYDESHKQTFTLQQHPTPIRGI